MTDEPDRGAPPAYFAPGARQRQHPHGADVHDGLMYSASDGYRGVELDVYVPSDRTEPAPLVVFIHGGAWLFGTRMEPPTYWPAGSLFQACIDAGIAVASIDYRHSREAAYPAQLHDAKAAVRYLRHFAGELGIDHGRIAAWGESAGGHLAALLALVTDPEFEGTDGITGPSSAVSAVVDFYGVSDVDALPPFRDSFPPAWIEELERAGKGAPAEPIDVLLERSTLEDARRAVSPVTHVTAAAPPFLLIHGEADGLVPIGQSELLHDALLAAGASSRLVRVPGADHVFLGTDPLPQIAAGVEFLKERFGV